MSVTCKAQVQLTVTTEVDWCSTDKTLDEFHRRVADNATNQVYRALSQDQTVSIVPGTVHVVTVITEPVRIDTPVPKETP